MPHANCYQCGTEIADHTSMVEHKGELYCCPNCVAAAEGGAESIGESCTHCGNPIVEIRTEVYRGRQPFCCNNCAQAVAARA